MISKFHIFAAAMARDFGLLRGRGSGAHWIVLSRRPSVHAMACRKGIGKFIRRQVPGQRFHASASQHDSNFAERTGHLVFCSRR